VVDGRPHLVPALELALGRGDELRRLRSCGAAREPDAHAQKVFVAPADRRRRLPVRGRVLVHARAGRGAAQRQAELVDGARPPEPPGKRK
jgi:hypothetical protein